ncbi:GntR family transcriptional regulator [Nocardia sp. NPDC051750]|uniref:GntR family transcriptional regulator n=1 Tax=Nocardia sp. NPDC051750 TaxID=3364325 RepID=UPI0037921EA9
MYSDTERVEFPFVGIAAAPQYVATALGLDEGSRVVQRRRVIHNTGSGPIELSTSWFPAALADSAPRLLVADRIRGGTLPYLADSLGMHAAYARDQVCARLASDDERAVLGLPETSPALVYWLVAFDSDDHPIQFDEAVYPPERWSFRQEYPINF